MKWSEMTKKAIEHGFKLVRHGGKHDLYRNEKGQEIWLERHGAQEVRKGMEKSLRKVIGF